ncbi:MAG: hypothetical protein KF816_17310 [Melioribacteraceae bacterium]|nr:hypothetical protein [Melioribacteraceae bacterium]
MWKVFIIGFLITAVIESILSSFSTVLFRGLDPMKLSMMQIKMLDGEATFNDKLRFFFVNLFSSLFNPLIYIIAGVITLIAYLIS